MVVILKEPTFTGASPSDLNRRIELQAPTRIPDGGGGFAVTYATIATVWAKISTLRTDEAILAMESTGTAVHNIMIRYRTDVKSSWRIAYAGKYYNIIGPPIDVNKAHRWLDLKAKEVA